jgi:hypothetical protein
MPLTPFLEGAVFRPDEIAVMVGAYEAALREMDLTSYNAPGAATLAKTIVMLAKQGERDPVRLRERAIAILSGTPPDAAAGG